MNLITKKYEIVIPIIARKTDNGWDFKAKVLYWLYLLNINKNSFTNWLDKWIPGKSIANGEIILIEDYLKGTFLKWNSNSGWMLTNELDVSVQAFCHWTYHYSKGKYLKYYKNIY